MEKLEELYLKQELSTFESTKFQKYPQTFINFVISTCIKENEKREQNKLRNKAIKKEKRKEKDLLRKENKLDASNETGKDITQKSLNNQFRSMYERKLKAEAMLSMSLRKKKQLIKSY